MKKILSILICVLLVTPVLRAGTNTHTLKAVSVFNTSSDCTNGSTTGGTVSVKGCSANAAGSSLSSQTAYGATATADIKEYDGWILDYCAKFALYATSNTGYYFTGWFTNCQGTGTPTYNVENTGEKQYTSIIGSTRQTKTYYAVFKEQTVYYDYAHAEVILIDGTGNILKDANDDYIRDGGWVAINEEASNAPTFTVGGTADANIKTYNGDKAEWSYIYYAKPDEANDYEFVGWYSATTLNKQLAEYGVIGPNIADETNKMYKKGYTSTIKYSNKANAPKAETMYAVFRKTQTYYHYGASVNIAGDELEREAKGRVYADNGEAGSNANIASNLWVVSKKDDQVYSQKNKEYTYFYYAKSLDPAKIAFKGWATTPSGDVQYTVADGEAFTFTHTVTSDNMSPEKPYRTPTFYAVFESHYYKSPSVAVATPSIGSGYVHVSLTPSNVDQCTREQIPVSDETYQVAANNRTTPYKVYYYAKPRPGAQFVGWSSTPDGLNIISQSPEVVVDCETSSTNANIPQVEAPRYAVFRSDIDIRQQDRMIVYIDDEGNGNINDSKVLIDFQKANTLTATLTGDDKDLFTLSNRSGSKSGSTITFDATQGLIELVVTYTGNLATAVGKVANITLSATYGGQTITRPVTIVVEEAPIITFLPTDDKGSYTVKMTNGSGVSYTMDAFAREELKVAVTHESMSNIEMALTSDVDADEYYFFGWQMIDEGNVTYLSYEDLTTYQFTKAVKVKAEFVHKDIATYSIVGDPNKTVYHDFALVMKDAERLVSTNGTQTVLLNDMLHGNEVKRVVLPKGNYTIPSNVRFIIPGKGLHAYREDLESTDLYKGSSSEYSSASANNFKNSEHIRWVVEDGTTITINSGSAICVQTMIVSVGADNPNGLPFNYGHIQLGENCQLNFMSGSKLISLGYITGPKSSSVIMNDGSSVKETLQIYDWRGGRATSTAYLEQKFQKNKLFLINQFFVQNIEAPLTIKAGAVEELEAGLIMSDDPLRMELTFISQNEGFFQLGDGYSITKYYDVNTDRIQFTVEAEVGATGSAEMGSISLEISGLGTVSSADYVLPLPHNYDVILGKNTKTNVLHDVAMLPGSSVQILEGAECNLGVSSTSNVYVYDKKYSTINGSGYCGAVNKEFYTIKTRPDGIKYVRNSASIQDAMLLVDGILKTPKGYLYTTNSSSETIDHANITSHGGGKVVFNALGANTNTKQGSYTKGGLLGGNVDILSLPVAPARLLNATGAYQVPTANTTYTYVNGLWKANSSETERPNIPTPTSRVPVFNVTDYTTSAYVGNPSQGTTTITTNNPNVNWTSADLTWTPILYGEHANQFRCTLGAKSNAVPVTITFTPTSDGVKTATLRITATYKYTDTYGVAGTYVYSKDIYLTGNAEYLKPNTLAFAELGGVYIGTTQYSLFKENSSKNAQGITLTLEPNNLVQLIGSKTDDKYSSSVKFKARSIGEVTITATQEPDLVNNVAGITISKKIKVTDRVLWNWDVLYFGTVNENPVTVLNGSTNWTLTETKDEMNIINFQGTRPADYTATIENQIAGKYTDIQFTFTEGKETKTFESHVITNPQHLRVDVNNDTVYRAVTLSANENVTFNNDQIEFFSTAQAISQWKMTFVGVPDKLHFIPRGTNTWQVEESANGVNWTTSFPWKYIASNTDFELSLLPSTRYLRISYGAGNVDLNTKVNKSILREFYITELADVKADVEKLYMPVDADGVTKEVVLTYANTGKLGVSTSDDDIFKVRKSGTSDAPTDAFTIPATTDENPFGITGVEVVSYATEETQGFLNVFEGSNHVLQIPISTYLFPQKLPIKLATDKPDGGDRYYFVTTHTHNAEWDGTDGVRKITLNNAVSDAAPYLTFAYDGAPTYIGFDFTQNVHGTWELEQFVEGEWKAVTPDSKDVVDIASGKFKRFVSSQARQLRVIYQSDYAEKVEITELVIVGDASVIVDPARMVLDVNTPEYLTVTAINLPSMTITSNNDHFKISYNSGEYLTEYSLTSAEQLGDGKMGDIYFQVQWSGTDAVEVGELRITTTINGEEKILGTVELTGIQGKITVGDIKMNTGVPEGYTLASVEDEENEGWKGDNHRPVNISAAFSPEGTPLFDYVVVYGETTTSDGSDKITLPNKMSGSNAKTPCYIYKKGIDGYEFLKRVENVNAKDKAWDLGADDKDAVSVPAEQNSVSMYITGFAPYASTGYTKADEGVWYFRANGGQSIDIYLEDCYIYSRAKTDDGHTFADRSDGYTFVEPYACGSGAVLVFACNEQANATPMNVTIHTLGNNLLKSNYGCFLQSIAGRAFQASSPVQIRVINDQYVRATRTTLNFTDEWPASKNSKTVDGIGNPVRTNGFLSLQKQVNNAPSIDMGAPNTIVNFNGGQVELQNAQIVSTNYASSLAICHRSGKFAGVPLAYGMGTDAVEGTVNFNDGTTTVRDMWVVSTYAESYLLDKDQNGDNITKVEKGKTYYLTSCLRTPANTFVYGGSHCMMRACTDPTTSGGAPRNKPESEGGVLLGLYKYPKLDPNPADAENKTSNFGWVQEGDNGLVRPNSVPDRYGISSVTPNDNGTPTNYDDDFLNFWFDPTFEKSVQPEVEKTVSFWKTCMTEISAVYAGYGGKVGGDATIMMNGADQLEIVKNLMYCQIDEQIRQVISSPNYYAPVKNPAPEGENYLPVHPSSVGGQIAHYVTNVNPFQVEDRVYYITTATADVWNAFTAPFDVANIYIMETYPESELEAMEGTVVDGVTIGRTQIIQEQAKHNADFAAFFAVTVALGQQKDFETIYREYMAWANMKDEELGLNSKQGYEPRGKRKLIPFDGSNWAEADFYLNENTADWIYTGEEGKEFTTYWTPADASDGKLMEQGKTYAMLLPFCMGCGEDINTRTFWDYWSGKFLIFESTSGSPHIIDGSAAMEEIVIPTMDSYTAKLTGNSTFSHLTTQNQNIYNYVGNLQHSTFKYSSALTPVQPTQSFLLANIPVPEGVQVDGVTRSGKIIYGPSGNGNTTGTHMPTVGGGNSLFITAINGGINIAVAYPQHVRVLSATGAVLYSGMVQTAVDVNLPTDGIYIVSGEREVQKILY